MNSPRFSGSLMPKPRVPKPAPKGPSVVAKIGARVVPVVFALLLVFMGLMSLPLILAEDVKLSQKPARAAQQFPVTVNPAQKTITTDPRVEKLLATAPTQLPAAAGFASRAFEWLALKIASLPIYQQLAGVAGAPTLFVNIPAGARQEQVASSFGSRLRWTAKQRAAFLTDARTLQPTLPQGSTVPGIYFASVSSPSGVASLVHNRFNTEIASHYSTTTDKQVPLEDAITIASLIQREAGSWDDMRMISGIIWNRTFAGMKLQIDATLQYAEANQNGGKTGWWPSVEPKDKYIKSAYNTYIHAGLPPAPIANPSVAAVLAALNPKQTDCLFYFHDKYGHFHCSKTYAEHVQKLKKYYGQGK